MGGVFDEEDSLVAKELEVVIGVATSKMPPMVLALIGVTVERTGALRDQIQFLDSSQTLVERLYAGCVSQLAKCSRLSRMTAKTVHQTSLRVRNAARSSRLTTELKIAAVRGWTVVET